MAEFRTVLVIVDWQLKVPKIPYLHKDEIIQYRIHGEGTGLARVISWGINRRRCVADHTNERSVVCSGMLRALEAGAKETYDNSLPTSDPKTESPV